MVALQLLHVKALKFLIQNKDLYVQEEKERDCNSTNKSIAYCALAQNLLS